MKKSNTSIVPIERIESKILIIRSEKVMLDADLANLYEVETKQLVRAMKRNIDRFLTILCSSFPRRNLVS